MTPLLYLMACLMSPSPPIDLAESRVQWFAEKSKTRNQFYHMRASLYPSHAR
jgi:hypothetical protein